MEVFVQNTQISPVNPPVRNTPAVQAPAQQQANPQVSVDIPAPTPVQDVSANGNGSAAVSAPQAPQTATPSYSPTTHLREEDISDYMIDRAFAIANKAIGGNFRLSYGTHEPTGRITIAVHDAETNELIREVPPESRLDLYVKITEFMGLLFDQSS